MKKLAIVSALTKTLGRGCVKWASAPRSRLWGYVYFTYTVFYTSSTSLRLWLVFKIQQTTLNHHDIKAQYNWVLSMLTRETSKRANTSSTCGSTHLITGKISLENIYIPLASDWCLCTQKRPVPVLVWGLNRWILPI